MVLVGPFTSYEELDEQRYKLRMKAFRPKSLGEYEESELVVIAPRNEVVEKNGKIYLDTQNPWLQTLGLNSKIIPPRVSGDIVENVVPIATIERTADRHRFYGYYIVFKDGKPIEIRGAGIYERIIPPGLEDKEPAIPARLVKDITELDKDEFITLARHTPPEFLPILHRVGRKDIVATNVAEMIRRNPLAVKYYPREIVEKYLVEQQDLIVKLALLENTPMVMKMLIEQLRSLGYDADKLSLVYMRYYEEKQEDKQLEKIKEEEKKRMEEYQKRLEDERQRQFIKEYGAFIKQVIGITLPLIISSPVVSTAVEKAVKAREKVSEVEEAEVSA